MYPSSVISRECNQGSDCSLCYHIKNTNMVSPPRYQTFLASMSSNISPVEALENQSMVGGQVVCVLKKSFHLCPTTIAKITHKKINIYITIKADIRSQLLQPRFNRKYKDVVSNITNYIEIYLFTLESQWNILEEREILQNLSQAQSLSSLCLVHSQ